LENSVPPLPKNAALVNVPRVRYLGLIRAAILYDELMAQPAAE